MLSPHEKNNLMIWVQKIWEYLNEQPTTTPCHFCKSYDDGHCKMWGDYLIPKQVRPNGCDKFEFDSESIPF